ncbi:hypothetical protein HYC85_014130 [Camellia sinensis]|uniref:Uncharacterized protein n=1 Tax=Camellia sinensis TaxID=4442 RepID=A0A7J7H5D1_CAMSI|nr:hypothetical protein HYC85_014130 [Camellia sinensis]
MDQASHFLVILPHIFLRFLFLFHHHRSLHCRLSLHLQARFFLLHHCRYFLRFSATVHHLLMGFSNHDHLQHCVSSVVLVLEPIFGFATMEKSYELLKERTRMAIVLVFR